MPGVLRIARSHVHTPMVYRKFDPIPGIVNHFRTAENSSNRDEFDDGATVRPAFIFRGISTEIPV